MTFTLDLPDHLAAPLELRPVSPTSWAPAGPSPALLADHGDGTPGFLSKARKTTDRHPDSAVAWARLAQAAQGAGRASDAVAASERALDLGLAQACIPAVHAAVVVLSAASEKETLRRLLDDPRSADLPPHVLLQVALEADAYEAAEAVSKRGAGRSGWVVQAWIQLRRRDYEAAIASSRRARDVGSVGPALLANMGYAHAALGNLEKAIKTTHEAAYLAPHDHAIAFNLASYRRMAGDFHEAICELERLKSRSSTSIDIALALADTYVEAGDRDRAHRVLQRVRTSSEWASADPIRRSELEANLALLRWMTKRERVDNALRAVLQALKASDFQSLSIGYLLMNLVRQPHQAGLLRDALRSLAQRHPQEELAGLNMQLAILTRDRDTAIQNARVWADEDVLNPAATALAVYLMTDLVGSYDDAANMGVAALKRAPRNPLLANNTAYALALAGRPDEAIQVVSRLGEKIELSVQATATLALARWAAGDESSGVAGYEKARVMAEDQGDVALAVLVDINATMARARLSGAPCEEALRRIGESLNEEWIERSDFWITSQRLARELQVDLRGLADGS